MVKRLLLMSSCLILPAAALAAPIVTWEASGETRSAISFNVGNPNVVGSPPIGTPYSVQLQFDPSARVLLSGASAGSGCYTTPVSGTFNLGGVGYSLDGDAFTNSMLPLTACATVGFPSQPPGAIEFFLNPLPLGDDPWRLSREPGFLMFSYFDAVFQDGRFPETPSPISPGLLRARVNDNFEFTAEFVPQAVDQSAPIPEPGSMTLFGLGLAAVARKVRRRRAELR